MDGFHQIVSSRLTTSEKTTIETTRTNARHEPPAHVHRIDTRYSEGGASMTRDERRGALLYVHVRRKKSSSACVGRDVAPLHLSLGEYPLQREHESFNPSSVL